MGADNKLEITKKCVHDVVDGKIRRPRQRVAQMAKVRETCTESSPPLPDALTRTEKTIINYVMHGWDNLEISRQLSISEQAFKKYLGSIYDKVGVSNHLEIVLYALHENLDLPPLKPLTPLLEPRCFRSGRVRDKKRAEGVPRD